MIEKRSLSGIYFRVKNGEKWDNVCFEDLPEDEQKRVMENRNIEWLQSISMQLAKTLKDIAEKFDITAETQMDPLTEAHPPERGG